MPGRQETRTWPVHSAYSCVATKSYGRTYTCVGVDYEASDNAFVLARTRCNGKLVIQDCDNNLKIEWCYAWGEGNKSARSAMWHALLHDDTVPRE